MGETTGVNVPNGGKRGPDDSLALTMEAHAARDGASSVPYSDAAAQDASYNSLGLSQFAEGVEVFVMCTPRNLELVTLCTVAQFIFRGANGL